MLSMVAVKPSLSFRIGVIIERKGFNYRITELQAALGVAQIKKSHFFVNRKKENNLCQKNRIQKSFIKNCVKN